MAQTTTIRNTEKSKLYLTVGKYNNFITENRQGRAIIHPVTPAGVVKTLPYPPLTNEEAATIFHLVNASKI